MRSLGYLFGFLQWWGIVWFYVYCLARGAHQARPAGQAWRILARVHQEMWPPAGVGIVLAWIGAAIGVFTETTALSRTGTVLAVIGVPFLYLVWTRAKDWPDNIWKRRLRKTRDRVTSVGHRLVVEPS